MMWVEEVWLVWGRSARCGRSVRKGRRGGISVKLHRSVAATGLPSTGRVQCYKNNAVHSLSWNFLLWPGHISFPAVGYHYLGPRNIPPIRSQIHKHIQIYTHIMAKHSVSALRQHHSHAQLPQTPVPTLPLVLSAGTRSSPSSSSSVPSTVPSRADMSNCALVAPVPPFHPAPASLPPTSPITSSPLRLYCAPIPSLLARFHSSARSLSSSD